jgi:hypothetical protein
VLACLCSRVCVCSTERSKKMSRAGSFYTIRSIIRFLRTTALHVVRVTRRRQQLTLAAYKTRRTRIIPSFTNVLDNFLLCIQSVSSLWHNYACLITHTILCNDFCLRHCNCWYARAVHGTLRQEPCLFGEKV